MKYVLKYIMMLAAIAAVPACSIKEDRSSCPCMLTVDFPAAAAKVMMNCWSQGHRIIDDVLEPDGEKCIRKYHVPKGSCTVSAIKGYEGLEVSGEVLLIPEGKQMACLYACASDVATDGETAEYSVDFKKNYVKVSLCFSDSETGLCPYDLIVRSNVAGLEMRLLAPVIGTFTCTPEIVDGKGYQFIIPRQLDETLSIDLMRGTEIYDTITLGRIIASSGYDWTAEALADIDFVIDLSKREISITVSGWDGPFSTTITI